MLNKFRSSSFLPFLLFALLLLLWGLFISLPLSWAGWAPATCQGGTGCFCEAIHPGPLGQPANSWSSLAFALPGLLVLARSGPAGFDDARRPFLRRPANRWIFGLALLVIGLGSAFYHASLTFLGQFFDVQGMYLLISFALLYALARSHTWNGRTFGLAYVLLNLALAVVLVVLPGIRREVFAGLVVATLVLEILHIRQHPSAVRVRYFGAALVSLAGAFVVWNLDNLRILCAPDSWFQGHALWHLLGALAAWCLFSYYRSEEISGRG